MMQICTNLTPVIIISDYFKQCIFKVQILCYIKNNYVHTWLSLLHMLEKAMIIKFEFIKRKVYGTISFLFFLRKP